MHPHLVILNPRFGYASRKYVIYEIQHAENTFLFQVGVHFIVSVIVTVTCVVGSILTITFGLCPSNKCSYSINYKFNQGMAAFLLFLNILSMAISIYSVYLYKHYRTHFVVHRKSQERFATSRTDFHNDMVQ